MYRYRAVNPAGEIEEGELDIAGGEAAAVEQLQDAGYLPIRIEPVSAERWWSLHRLRLRAVRGRLGSRDIEFFTRELATLLRAGLPLDQSLQTLIDVADSAALKRLVLGVDEDVRRGNALSEALASRETGIPDLLINMVRAGEASGTLDASLERLADYLARSRDLRESIMSTLLYPLILVVVAALSVVALLIFVLPQFSQMFADLGVTPPYATRVVLAAGAALRAYWWLAPGIGLGAVLLGRHWLANPAHRRMLDTQALRVPLLGALITKTELSRFTHTLGTLIAHGVPLVKSLEIVSGSMRNEALRHCVTEATQELQKGRGLSSPLSASGLFPALAVNLIRIGEESGRLHEMLLRLADIYEREVRATLKRSLTLLEPVLIIGLGIVVASIIFAILSAVLGINEAVL